MRQTLGLYLAVLQEPLNLQDKITLNIILNQLNRKYWSIDDLAQTMGVSVKTTANSLKSLESKGYIKREMQEGKRYYITRATTKACALIGRRTDDTPIGPVDEEALKRGEEIQRLFRKVVYGKDE